MEPFPKPEIASIFAALRDDLRIKPSDGEDGFELGPFIHIEVISIFVMLQENKDITIPFTAAKTPLHYLAGWGANHISKGACEERCRYSLTR